MSLTLTAEDWALADCYAATFTQEMGKRVLRDLEQKAGLFTELLTRPIDLHELVARAAVRDFYLGIRRQIAIAAETDRKLPEVTGALDAYGNALREFAPEKERA